MSVQKYQINDRVKRPNKNFCLTNPNHLRNIRSTHKIGNCRYGTITETKLKANNRKPPRFTYFYYVKWDDSQHVSLHSQNTLKPVEEK